MKDGNIDITGREYNKMKMNLMKAQFFSIFALYDDIIGY